MEVAYAAGGAGAHIIPEGAIPEAVRMVRGKFFDFIVYGSLLPPKIDEGIEELVSLDSKIIFLHGEISDAGRLEVILDLMEKIKSRGVIPGVATHRNPPDTLKLLVENRIDVPVLIPFNKLGFAMGNKERLENMVDRGSFQCIGMKTLAAGMISPDEAFDYVSKHNIKAVTFGAVAEKEVKETIASAFRFLYSNKRH